VQPLARASVASGLYGPVPVTMSKTSASDTNGACPVRGRPGCGFFSWRFPRWHGQPGTHPHVLQAP
jgi:hypothetical protein